MATVKINSGSGKTVTINKPGDPASVRINDLPPSVINMYNDLNTQITANPSLVFDPNWNYIGIAEDAAEIVSIWNADPDTVGFIAEIVGQSNQFNYQGFHATQINGQENKVTKSGTGLLAFGDSITNPGSDASPSSESWINQLATWLSLSLTNYGVSGNGVWKALDNAYLNMADTGNDKMVAILVGYNDMRKGGTNIKTTNMIVNSIRGLIANCFLSAAVAISEASVTKTGSIGVTFVSSAVGGKADRINSAYRGGTLNENAAKLTWAFTSDNVVVGFIGADGTNRDFGSFEVKIDGVSYGIYNCDDYADGIALSYDYQRVPGALVFTGLVNTSHTLEVIAQADCSVSTPAVIDYLGYMMAPASCKPVVLGEVLKMTAAGYVSGSVTAGSDAAVDQINEALGNMLRSFVSWPVAFAATGKYYDPASDVSGDNIHPTNQGHDHITTPYQNVITL